MIELSLATAADSNTEVVVTEFGAKRVESGLILLIREFGCHSVAAKLTDSEAAVVASALTDGTAGPAVVLTLDHARRLLNLFPDPANNVAPEVAALREIIAARESA